jgi:hypothetical protein
MKKSANRPGFIGALLFLMVTIGAVAGPMDKVVQFYTSSIPKPPRVDMDVAQVVKLAETGDIIIENHRGFPQWYAAIGVLIPGTRYVHAGMVIKGHELKAHLEKISGKPFSSQIFHAYVRCLQTVKDAKGRPSRVWQWVKAPIDSKGKYVITPEVTRGATMSRVVPLHIKHYLQDPAVGYPCKHIALIRPPIPSQKALSRLAMYLAYHAFKETGYDMGFQATESEPAIQRDIEGELTFDLSLAPVPLYCTELIWRALREIQLEVPPTKVSEKISGTLARIPRIPKALVEKLRSPFITADLFLKSGSIVYANALPPSVSGAIGNMVDQTYKNWCRGIADFLHKSLAPLRPNSKP